MTYEQFEQAILANPWSRDPELLAKAESCAQCGALLAEAQALDERLASVMAVPVPAALTGEIPDMAQLAGEVDNVVALRPPQRSRTWVPAFAAMAAAAVLAVVVVLRQPEVESADVTTLTAEVLEHLSHEPEVMKVSNVRVTSASIISAMAPAGATMSDMTAPVSYARTCIIDGRPVPHLVVQGANGPVTVLVLADQIVDGPVSFMQDGYEGVIVPVGDGGSIAIIGEDTASVEAVREVAGETLGISI